MKAYTVEWNNGVDTNSDESGRCKWGSVTVVADSLTKAIARFQKEYHPDRIIDAVRVGNDTALIDGE